MVRSKRKSRSIRRRKSIFSKKSSLNKQCRISPNKAKKKCTTDSMAGHEGAFINIHEQNQSYCGKSIASEEGRREYEFLKRLYTQKEWRPFIPNLYNYGRDTCLYNGKRYMIMDNMLKGLVGSSDYGGDIKFLDIKLGRYTSSYAEQRFIRKQNLRKRVNKNIKHAFLDSISGSVERGYRIEGLNFPIQGVRYKKGTTDFLKINPILVIKTFMPKNIKLRKDILKKLYTITKLYFQKEDQWSSTGSSLFIAHDEKKAIVKMIDFAHAYYRDACGDENCRLMVSENYENTLFGMEGFYTAFSNESGVDV